MKVHPSDVPKGVGMFDVPICLMLPWKPTSTRQPLCVIMSRMALAHTTAPPMRFPDRTSLRGQLTRPVVLAEVATG